jgi:uncharacterized membrane protein
MDFLFTAKFIKIVFTSAIILVLLNFLTLALITSTCYRQTPGYHAEPDPQGKVIFNFPFGLMDVAWGTLQAVLASACFISIAISVNQS